MPPAENFARDARRGNGINYFQMPIAFIWPVTCPAQSRFAAGEAGLG